MEFSSALPYAKVRDFAYHDRHPLYYGVRPEEADPTPDPGDQPDQVDQNEDENNLESEDNEQERGNIKRTPDDIYRRAVALFDFEPENCNEARLVGGQVVWISYRHGQGWLVAENLETGETGLVPEEYVQVLPENESEWEDTS